MVGLGFELPQARDGVVERGVGWGRLERMLSRRGRDGMTRRELEGVLGMLIHGVVGMGKKWSVVAGWKWVGEVGSWRHGRTGARPWRFQGPTS